MTTYTYESEKQVLKLYIRLLLYVNDKYSENESSKIDPNSLLGYLHSLKEETLLQQVLKNKSRNNEMYNDGQALDVSFYDLYNENIDSAEPLAPAKVPAETLDTGPYSEQYKPPFPNSATIKGKEPILSPEQRKMVNTIKTNSTLVGVYTLLLAVAKDIQLQFIEAALPMFNHNKWDEKTPFDKSAQETLIKLITEIKDEEERKRILAQTPLIAQTQYKDEDEEALDTDPYAEQYRPPFPNLAAMTGKEPILSPEQRKMVNTIKTNPTLVGVHAYLLAIAKDIQLKFIEVALTLFTTNKWNENTPFDKPAKQTLIQLITKLVEDEEERKRILAATPLIAQTQYKDEDEEELAQESEQLESEQLAQQQLAQEQLAPQQLAQEQLAPQQLESEQQLAQQQLAPQQLAQEQLAPQQLAQEQLAPQQLTPAQQKRKVTFATPEQTQPQAQAQAPLIEEQRQTNRIALMADKNPMQKFKILIGPQVINGLRLTKDDDFKKWYTNSKNKSNLIFSLDALIQALNTNMKTGESFTKILDKSTAEIPNYIKSTVAKVAIKVLLAISAIKTLVTNVKTNILKIYNYSNGINDFIQDLTEVVADLTRINNSVIKK